MKHKTWFRLVLKAIGILIIVLHLPEAIGVGWMLVADVFQGGGTWGGEMWLAGHVIGNLAAIAIGLYLLLGGEWLVNYVIPSNRRYCPDCGYDVSEPEFAKKCAECGAVLPRDDADENRATMKET